MDYLCAECNTTLSKWEMFLNEKYPVGKLYCEFCQTKHERVIIKKIAESEADMHNDYTRDLLGDVSHSLLDKGDNNESN